MRAGLRLVCLLMVMAAAGTAVASAAAPLGEATCRAVGADAGRIAVLRDAGRSIEEAVASVSDDGSQSTPAARRIAAALLFARFRLMSPENAAFEFYLDCLDDQETVTSETVLEDRQTSR